MALTKHQKHHLKQLVKDMKEEKNTKNLKQAEDILNGKKEFPALEHPADIHDFLEKDKDGKKWPTP